MSKFFADVQVSCFDNDCYIPEIWARESLEILFETMVVANMVHRTFEDEIASFGDVVHTRKPAESKIKRRTDDTVASTLNQSTSSTDVPVTLNQWFNQTFTIKPGEGSKSFKNLVDTYLAPRMKVMARAIDRVVLGRMAASFGLTPATRAGTLCGLTSATAYEAVVELDKILNQNKAPQDGRSLLISPAAKAALLKCDKFVEANRRGDGVTAIATAELGSILNFNVVMCQNVNSMETGADISGTALTITEPYAAEWAAALAAASIGTEAVNGEYVNIDGNDQPTYISSHIDSTSITLNEALKYAVLDNAIITRYKSCAVSTTAVLGWSEDITLKSYTTAKAPQVGQLISFCDASTGANRHTYTVIESTDAGSTCTVLLDRPLERTITQDSTVVCPGPYGSFNPSFHRNALALVTRPLAPQTGAGMLSAVASADGIGVTVAMQDKINEGRVVAIDLLCGTAVLDAALCVPLLG